MEPPPQRLAPSGSGLLVNMPDHRHFALGLRSPQQWMSRIKRLGWGRRRLASLRFSPSASPAGSLDRIAAILHIGDAQGGEFHVDLWLEHLRAAGTEVLVVARSTVLFNALARRSDLKAAYARSGRDAEDLIARMRAVAAVFYTSNTGNSIHFIRAGELSHVFLGHGDSDKSASSHKYFRVYDEIWTAGQAHIDRLTAAGIGIASDRCRIVGRPSLKHLSARRESGQSTGTFLYLPTWEGYYESQNYTSLDIGPGVVAVAAAATGKTPVVKLHPWTGKQDTALAKAEERFRSAEGGGASPLIVARSRPASELMGQADFLIADVSSVVTDFLINGGPMFVYTPEERPVRFSGSRIALSEYAYVFRSAPELAALIQQVLIEGDDWMFAARRRALDYLIGMAETEAGAFGESVRRVTRSQSRQGEGWPQNHNPVLG